LQGRIRDLEEKVSIHVSHEQNLQSDLDAAKSLLNSLKTTLDRTELRLSDAGEREKKLREDIQVNLDRWKEAQTRLEQESIARLSDLATLNALRRSLEEAERTAKDSQDNAKGAESDLRAKEQSWKEQEESFKRQLDELENRITDLSNQNRILHSQLESFTSSSNSRQAAFLSSLGVSSSSSSSSSSIEGLSEAQVAAASAFSPNSNREDLLEVIKFLRHRNQIAESKAEVEGQAAARFRQQCEQALRSLDEARARIREEQDRTRAHIQTEQVGFLHKGRGLCEDILT
jgi:nucleoprotein TPR